MFFNEDAVQEKLFRFLFYICGDSGCLELCLYKIRNCSLCFRFPCVIYGVVVSGSAGIAPVVQV
jgi:hypothetical protein